MDPSTIDRFWKAVYLIPVAAFERATSYAIFAGIAYVLLHVLLARWLAKRRIAPQAPPISQMTRLSSRWPSRVLPALSQIRSPTSREPVKATKSTSL